MRLAGRTEYKISTKRRPIPRPPLPCLERTVPSLEYENQRTEKERPRSRSARELRRCRIRKVGYRLPVLDHPQPTHINAVMPMRVHSYRDLCHQQQ